MALQKCGLNLNRNRLELQPHGTLDFPCAGFCSQHTDSSDDIIPWHWHEEMEIIYVASGRLKLRVPGKTVCLQQGEAVFINSNILHFAAAETHCEIHSLVFHSTLITGQDQSIFALRYITPLINCMTLNICHLTLAYIWEKIIVSDFIHAFDAIVLEPSGYEFTVRENLSHFCLTLYQQYEQEVEKEYNHQNQDSMRMRKMLDFIHEHYSDHITLAQIAKSADIGERECLRCFQKEIQISPMQYLIKYRVTLSATMLSQTPGSSISEISTKCGFDSPSNFSQMFKRFFLCTPGDYRKRL
ncbi:MAG: cupin [Lacrimispora sp.]|nr:cupin [Lacrimispora sp.]